MRLLPKLLSLSLLGLLSVGFVFAAGAVAGKITGGERQSCAVTPAGAVVCWGQRSAGSLGDGKTSGSSYKPVQVAGLKSGATEVAATRTGNGGSHYACAVVRGAAKCWGTGGYGTLGDGKSKSSAVPVQVTGLTSGVTTISLNATHACAVQNGAVMCWGSGYLGGGGPKNSPVPVQAFGLSAGATAVAVGWRHACALVSGAVWCWTGKPALVPGLSGVTAIAAGTDFTCALVGGGVQCWGRSTMAPGRSKTPVPITGLESGVTAISANASHACAIKGGSVWCWGANANGQLGNGAKLRPGSGGVTVLTPVQVKGLSGVTSIGVGLAHTCAITAKGVRWCWGSNSGGQLGNRAAGSQTSLPVKVAPLK